MELLDFHKMRRAVQSNAARGSEQDLAEVRDTLHQELVASGFFEDVEVGCTDDADHLVIAMVTFPEQLDRQSVAHRLERLWRDRLRYPFWEAHAMLVDRDQIELEGATRSGTTGHYVTVHVVAQQARVPAQRLPRD